MERKLQFILKKRNDFYGPSYGLVNSSRFTAHALEEKLHIDSQVSTVVDGNGIDRVVAQYSPTHVIIEALWVTPDKIRQLLKVHHRHRRHWVVLIHSKAPFIANEGIAFDWIQQYINIKEEFHNFSIASNNKEFAWDLSSVLGTYIEYLPNIYMPKTTHENQIERHWSCFIDIGCFGAIRPLKNQLEQAIAAIIFADNHGKILRFHINFDRLEQRGDEVLRNIRNLFAGSKHQLVEHCWREHHEFLRIVREMDIGMQVSMSESFNICTADFVLCNVPMIVSKDITWMPRIWRCDPTDTNDIVFHLEMAYLFGGRYINRIALRRYNNKSLGVWKKYLRI